MRTFLLTWLFAAAPALAEELPKHIELHQQTALGGTFMSIGGAALVLSAGAIQRGATGTSNPAQMMTGIGAVSGLVGVPLMAGGTLGGYSALRREGLLVSPGPLIVSGVGFGSSALLAAAVYPPLATRAATSGGHRPDGILLASAGMAGVGLTALTVQMLINRKKGKALTQ
jgi:hypothetical protein